MLEGQGLRACAYHLVGVAAQHNTPIGAAPGAFGIRRTAPRASLRSLAGVDVPVASGCFCATQEPPLAAGNRRPDMYTPDDTEFDSDNAWNQNFDDGNQDNDNKNNEGRCRAVRK
jgi:hypothetical protein